MRLKIMERDEFSCRRCRDDESALNVHHAYYEPGRMPWEYPSDTLFTFCEKCHLEVEDHKKSISLDICTDGGGEISLVSRAMASDCKIASIGFDLAYIADLRKSVLRDPSNDAVKHLERAIAFVCRNLNRLVTDVERSKMSDQKVD